MEHNKVWAALRPIRALLARPSTTLALLTWLTAFPARAEITTVAVSRSAGASCQYNFVSYPYTFSGTDVESSQATSGAFGRTYDVRDVQYVSNCVATTTVSSNVAPGQFTMQANGSASQPNTWGSRVSYDAINSASFTYEFEVSANATAHVIVGAPQLHQTVSAALRVAGSSTALASTENAALDSTIALAPGRYVFSGYADQDANRFLREGPEILQSTFSGLFRLQVSEGGPSCKAEGPLVRMGLSAVCLFTGGRYLPQWSKAFGDGSRLDVACSAIDGAGSLAPPAYMLWYTDRQGRSHRIAQCLFGGGLNEAFYQPGLDAQGRECLVRTTWWNYDAGGNDNEPRSAPDLNGQDLVLTTADEPYFDVVGFGFDANRGKLSWRNDKYGYPNRSNSMSKSQLLRLGGKLQRVPGLGIVHDPPVGPETERMFDLLAQKLPRDGAEPMEFLAPCDLDLNGTCTQADVDLASGALDACTGTAKYLTRADTDGDGCVSAADVETFKAALSEQRAGCTRPLAYWKKTPNVWPTKSLTLGDRKYEQPDLLALLGLKSAEAGLFDLVQQLIVAKLNIAAGASPLAVPIGSLDALLVNKAPGPLSGQPNTRLTKSEAAPYVKTLTAYNRGKTGPSECTSDAP